MENLTQINLLTYLSIKNWKIDHNGKSFFYKVLPPSELKLPESFSLVVPKEESDLYSRNLNDVIKTIANLYNLKPKYFQLLLANENFSKLTEKEIEKKINDVKEPFENIRFLRGSSFIYDTFIIIVFMKFDESNYIYEYYDFLKYKEKLFKKGERTTFSLETIEELDKDPFLFALSNAEQQSINSMRTLISNTLNPEEFKNNFPILALFPVS